MKLWDKIRHAYSLLTSDLSLPDIMRGLKSDASSTYDFYSSEAEPHQTKKPKFFKLIKNLFLAFIKKLTPIRRIAYIVVLIFFFSGLNEDNGQGKVLIAFLVLNIILAAELADKLTVKDELDIARNIQIEMMPDHPPEDDRFDIAFKYETANTVGGDFYDFLISPNKEGFLAMVGDISGKGMEAALHMVQVHALIHSHPYPSDLGNMLVTLNSQLKTLFPANQFLTANFLKIEKTNSFEFYRTGHLPIYHYSSKTKKCKSIAPSGIGLGLTTKTKLQQSLEKMDINVASGDVLCLCTDGVVEVENLEAQEFGESRLIDALVRNHQQSANQMIISLLTEIATFRGSTAKKDDLTLLILKIK